jgi:hypothetical protein
LPETFFTESFDGAFQSFLVAGVLDGMGWTEWTKLAKRKIAAKNSEAIICEPFRYSNQQRRAAVRAGAMGQN